FSGLATPGTYDQVIYRGDLERRQFIAFWLNDGRVAAAMNVNVWDVTAPLQHLIRTGARVDADRLRDPDVPLDQLAPNEVTVP
ncbi:MAG TPA: oxidoreductase C-terminal domain-containing protein, partial [Actinopolymorphaceae bacterium]